MLAVSLVALIVLAALGIGVEKKLTPTALTIPNTESARGDGLLRQHFGESSPFAILLHGPAAQLDRQGPRLIAVLRRDPKVTTLSPWDRGIGLNALRPEPSEALILADFHASPQEAVASTVPKVQRILARWISPPVIARAASYAAISRAIQDESVAASKREELIVVPILLIILLLVFRSPVAAAIPLAFGATTVIASRGLMALATGAIGISGFALSVASMLGLALGVDYGLLIVSRFREELAAGSTPAMAATATRMTAGRTTVFAGATLTIAMLISAFLVPGELLVSLSVTIVMVIALAVIGPAVIGPPLLVLLGPNIDRWRIPLPGARGDIWMRISRGALRNPRTTVALISVLLLLIAAPVLSLSTGPPSIAELPPSNSARRNVETVEAAVAGGWATPAIVVLSSRHGPLTQPRQLASLQRWQASVARDPEVAAVIGPGSLARRIAPLEQLGRSLLGKKGGNPVLMAMTQDLGRAVSGVTRLRRGLGRASEGAGLLALGSGRAHRGAAMIADGLEQANVSGARARASLHRFSSGAHLLADGQGGALIASSTLDLGIGSVAYEVGSISLDQERHLSDELEQARSRLPEASTAARQVDESLKTAWRELGEMTVGTGDPHYAATQAALREALAAASGADPVTGEPFADNYAGLAAELSLLRDRIDGAAEDAHALRSTLGSIGEGVAALRRLGRHLHEGLAHLKRGGERLAGGSDRIVSGTARLGHGLDRLGSGASRLSAGLARLRSGDLALEHGLSVGFRRAQPLVAGAREAEVTIGSGRKRLRHQSPGLFDSGYFVLSALDGARPKERRFIGQAVDLTHGDQGMVVLVVSKRGPDDPRTTALDDSLGRRAARLGREIGADAAVTGAATQLTDYDRSTSARLPVLMIAVALVTFFTLIFILRALPLAAMAVFLNLVTVAAAFGVLRLLFDVPEGLPFAGMTYVDAIGAAGIFGVVFGLSIDYSVFLLMRMRESWVQTGDNEAAIVYGLEHTANVITGAAAIIAAVFLVLATAPVAAVAQFGVGLTVAILLDATAIRLLLMPALMKLAGPRIWWLPRALDRCLPRMELHGDGMRA